MSYADRYIAMCDILGFKSFIQKTNLEEAVNHFSTLRKEVIQKATQRTVRNVDKLEGYRLDIKQIPWVIFSDMLLKCGWIYVMMQIVL